MGWRDIPELSAIERAVFGDDPWAESTWWAELAERPRRRYLVIEGQDASVAAYGGVDVVGDTSDLMTLAVAPGHQGRGLGARLLQTLRVQAHGAGAHRMLLEVRADNAAALALYRRAGFTDLRTRRRYYRDGVDALVLQAVLTDG